MLSTVLCSCVLVVTTVFVHAVGFSALLRAVLRSGALEKPGFWWSTGSLIAVTCWLMLIHSVEICVWGLFYWWKGGLPDAESAFYFSGITYTTVGYGDIVLSGPLRMLAPVEALAGVLMCGLSAGLFFAFVYRRIINWLGTRTPV